MSLSKYLIILLSILCLPTKASHILGGEMSVENIIGARYELKLSLYFDALDGNDVVEDSILVSSFRKADHQRIDNFFLVNNGDFTKPEINNSICNEGLNIRIYTYSAQIFLDGLTYNSDEGYYFSWQRCCRANSIANLNNSGTEGYVFYLEFPDLSDVELNSSPKFSPLKGDYYCSQSAVQIDFSCSDKDNDELRYKLDLPLAGISNENDKIVEGIPGPYNTAPGYTLIPSASPVEINDNGIVTFTPLGSGLYVLPVVCEEYRDNEKIGEVRRELTIMVRNCETNDVPILRVFKGANSELYNEGDTLFIKDKNDLCHRIQVEHKDHNENLFLRVRNSTIPDLAISFNPKNGYSNAQNDLFESEFCLETCQDLDGDYFEFTIEVEDSYCPIKEKDDIKIKVKIIESENRPPSISSNYVSRAYSVGDKIEFSVFATDPDSGDIADISMTGSDFQPVSLGMDLSVTANSFETRGDFHWEPLCIHSENKNDYRLLFKTNDGKCGLNTFDTLNIHLYIESENKELFGDKKPPNVITANGDGFNDFFHLPKFESSDCYSEEFVSVNIYNRWGKLVYRSDDLNFRFHAENIPAGDYFYLLDFGELKFKGVLHVFK